MMNVSAQTIKALGNVITDYPYRSGPILVTFFNQFGWVDEYSQGFPSRWKYAQDKIQELNNTDQMVRLIEQVVDPRNFLGTDLDVENIVADLNNYLQYDGYELTKDKLHYKVHRKRDQANSGNPVKNLIFASTGPKPELVLRDALNNDIEIVKYAETCLVYERHISEDGLLWHTLVQWWAEKYQLPFPDKATDGQLYNRLKASLVSHPEKILFHTYFSSFHSIIGKDLPALIPQVYLHYDPKTLQELNGQKRLARQRMDFLMLFPDNHRIIIEVDGKQHYADDEIASPRKYSEMVLADRELRLSGYEVYRFGGFELSQGTAKASVVQFFEKLLHKHRLIDK